jgi:hypothetical protein
MPTTTPAYWLIYRDVADFPRKQFSRMRAPRPTDLLISDSVLPGMHDYADMYVQRHECVVEGQAVTLISYTEAAITDDEAQALATQGLRALEEGR